MVVYGTVCLDLSVPLDAEGSPLPGEPTALPGGEAFNTATCLVGWEVRVALAGTALGADAEGDRLRSLLDDPGLGLPRNLIPDVADAQTPVCTIRVFPDGERVMSGRGFARAVAPASLPPDLLAGRPVFACDSNLGEPAVTSCLAAAHAGCPVVAMDFAHRPEIVRACRLLVTSRDVLGLECGRGSGGDAERAARRLLDDEGAPTAIVTLGADGAVVADRAEGVFRVPAFAVTAVDTTGAGDTFRAGLCYGLIRDWPLRQTVRFAAAAAALHCEVWGGGSRIPLDRVLYTAGLP